MILNNKIWKSIVACNLLWVICTSCGVYSFTGASLSPDIKTLSIQNFANESGLGPSRLQQTFTEKVKEYYLQNTNLKLTKSDGDIQLEGAIVGYEISPVGAAQGQGNFQTAQQNRLTIRVKAKFTNQRDETQDFDRQFSFYQDFDQNQNLASVEAGLIDRIFEQIVLDLFNASVANW